DDEYADAIFMLLRSKLPHLVGRNLLLHQRMLWRGCTLSDSSTTFRRCWIIICGLWVSSRTNHAGRPCTFCNICPIYSLMAVSMISTHMNRNESCNESVVQPSITWGLKK